MTPRNYDVTVLPEGGIIKHWTRGVSFESSARRQVENLARMPFIHRHVAVMPDVHAGIGATVGSVIATKDAIIPAAVGCDIGCGMMAVRTNLMASDLPDNLKAMRLAIEEAVPVGQSHWDLDHLSNTTHLAWGTLAHRMLSVLRKHPKITHKNVLAQLGTLGGGNHFIEVCIDEDQQVWLMLHSGSRGVGNRIGQYFIEKAKREMERWMVHLPDQDLAYFPEGSELFNDYIEAVGWAQDYASMNRCLMMDAVVKAVQRSLPTALASGFFVDHDQSAINCHHNYVEREKHFGREVYVTRKGAVRARECDLGVIPGSMGAKSFIVRGKGNPDSFHSCSHGAGRVMSRGDAKRRFTVEDHEAATAGVECRKDASVIDETPHAYKDIDAVMAAQSDLVEIVHTLKQVLCVKG